MIFDFKKISIEDSGKLQVLKVFLLLQVVVGHAIALSTPVMDKITIDSFESVLTVFFKLCFSFGRESAYLFVLFSGFFTSKVFNNFTQPFGLGAVLKRRLVRIYPVFILSLIFTFIIDYFGSYVLQLDVYEQNGLNYPVKDHIHIDLFIKNLLSLQPTFSLTFGSNGPLWTLGYLVQFFLVASFLRAFVNNKQKLLHLYFGFFLGLMWIPLGTEFCFLLFVWYSGIILRNVRFRKSIPSLIYILGMIFCLSISKISGNYISMLFTPITGFFMLHIIRRTPASLLGIHFSKFSKLPDVFYSLYATHMPILFLLCGLFTYIKTTHIFSLCTSVLYICLSVIISLLFSIAILRLSKLLFKP